MGEEEGEGGQGWYEVVVGEVTVLVKAGGGWGGGGLAAQVGKPGSIAQLVLSEPQDKIPGKSKKKK